MKKARVLVDGILSGELQEIERGKKYRFVYCEGYQGPSVISLYNVTSMDKRRDAETQRKFKTLCSSLVFALSAS